MAALATDRRTPRWETPDGPVVSYGVKAQTCIHAGSLVQLDASGWAIPAARVSSSHVTVGRAERGVLGGAMDGDVTVEVRVGVFRWENGDDITRAEIGDTCFALDDQTVLRNQQSYTHQAGRIVDVDDTGVWVATGIPYLF